VGEARGEGLIGALELVKDKETRENFDTSVAVYCSDRCLDHGLILRTAGGTSVCACPPLIITEDEIHALFDRFKLALDDTWDYVQKESMLAAAE
jgi:adenosylmethionine-8-amino-7-oxononanoate aminotransferase